MYRRGTQASIERAFDVDASGSRGPPPATPPIAAQARRCGEAEKTGIGLDQAIPSRATSSSSGHIGSHAGASATPSTAAKAAFSPDQEGANRIKKLRNAKFTAIWASAPGHAYVDDIWPQGMDKTEKQQLEKYYARMPEESSRFSGPNRHCTA